jgi:hypothetical protein
MRLSDRAYRRVMRSIWIGFAAWSFTAPLAGHFLYQGPESKPHGVAKVLFVCHL